MLRSDLTLKIAAASPRLYQRDAEGVLNAILETIAATLARGDRVELRGLGVFVPKRSKARDGRDPRTGRSVAVKERAHIGFRPSAIMHRRLNGDQQPLTLNPARELLPDASPTSEDTNLM